MAQSISKIIDHRILEGKLACIDREWESLKGLLTSRAPDKNQEPARTPAAPVAGPMEMADNVVDFPGSPSAGRMEAGFDGIRGRMAVTSREMEAIVHRNGKNGRDKTPMGRLGTVESQLHRLTLIVAGFMTLIIVLAAVFTFMKFKDNFLKGVSFLQPQERVVTSNPSGPQDMAPAPDRSLPGVAETVQPSERQWISATALPVDNIVKSSVMEPSAAAPRPVPKFVGSRTSNKAHCPDCKWAAQIDPRNLITFPSLEAARQQGYLPCPVCRPHDDDTL